MTIHKSNKGSKYSIMSKSERVRKLENAINGLIQLNANISLIAKYEQELQNLRSNE